MHHCSGWTGSQPGTVCPAAFLPLCHTAHLRWHGLLCQVLGGIWGAGCCCHVEEETPLAFQGKGLKFLLGPFGSHLVGRPGSVRHFLRAVMIFFLSFVFFFFCPFLPDPLPLGF